MNTPNILYYGFMERITGTQTPKYVITHEAGYYEPISQLIGRDGKVSFFLIPKRESQPSSTPPVFLQAKNSYNLTGLKDYYQDGKISGFAYGYPNQEPTYKYKGKDAKNPFYENRQDGYLFIIHNDKENLSNLIPSSIELVVLESAKVLISAYCKQLVMGGFDDVLQALRKQAQTGNVL